LNEDISIVRIEFEISVYSTGMDRSTFRNLAGGSSENLSYKVTAMLDGGSDEQNFI
jgi:hypothetical protein